LEHFISERFEDRVAELLGDPQIDPHGHVIPQKHGSGSFSDEVSLADWPVGETATITSVGDRDPVALRELERLGLVPGASIDVEQRNPNSSVVVRIAGRGSIRIRHALAAQVSVTIAT